MFFRYVRHDLDCDVSEVHILDDLDVFGGGVILEIHCVPCGCCVRDVLQ
jgi:hypothetical protein